MKGDFTRSTFRRNKHYSGVRHLQGRVFVDADPNEQADITRHRIETETKDVIGASGGPQGPDGGFALSAQGLDFLISKGRYYVDGILCENEEDVLYTKQPDFQPDKPITAGSYLVYLDVWRRFITALDDPEIREVALGGPDHAGRVKTVWQVKLFPVEDGSDCSSDLPKWKTSILPSSLQLSARVAKANPATGPCILEPGAGYRRLENQLYRVEIHEVTGSGVTFKWSRDNGSVVSTVDNISGAVISLGATRHDSAQGFAPGQLIELVDDRNEWNQTPGTLVEIDTVNGLDITVKPGALFDFKPEFHPKARRWDSAKALNVTFPSNPDDFLPLEDGVEVQFTLGTCRPGDYWLIPARTNTGHVEWPVDNGKPVPQTPHGIAHHYCRLAVIQADSNQVSVLYDCRNLFPPLTETEDCCGCCTVTVSKNGGADFKTIQEAINSLPPGSGGKVCVLPGVYRENIVLKSRADITIAGCDYRSIIAASESHPGPLLLLEKCQNIRIESLAFEAAKNCAIQAEGSTAITIRECEIAMLEPRAAEPAIYFDVRDGLIERNIIHGGRIKKREQARREATTPTLLATYILVAPNLSGSHGVSGIQLAGGAQDVRVLDNLIVGVSRQGITLGNLDADPNGPGKRIIGHWVDLGDSCDDCKPVSNFVWVPGRPGGERPPLLGSPRSLRDILIARNRILATGLDGIGVIGFFDLSGADEFVSVYNLTLRENEIQGCLRRQVAAPPANLADSMGYGGVALADVESLVVRDNTITDNGTAQFAPICGVFLLHGQGVDLSDNRILNNGQAVPARLPTNREQSNVADGLCGGIRIVYAIAPVMVPEPASSKVLNGIYAISMPDRTASTLAEPTGFPALKVHDNIVSTPRGPALWAGALGPVSVVANQFTSGSLNFNPRVQGKSSTVFSPATVFLLNLGVSNEVYLPQLFSKFVGVTTPQKGLDDARPFARVVNGNILFTDNQCSLDLLEPGASQAFVSIFLLSLDDVAFQNNQCDCNLGLGEDRLVAHAMIAAPSVRVTANRFKEGLLQVAHSAITTGWLNDTTHNQSTHCLQINGQLVKNDPNTILITSIPIFKDHCSLRLVEVLAKIIKN